MKFQRLAKKRYVTLIEMMIVMFLIALITGVVAYNYRGSLDEGKKFKTKVARNKIEQILTMRIAEDPSLLSGIENNWSEIVKNDPLVQDPKQLLTDGWGSPFVVTVENNNTITVTSVNLAE